MSSEATVFPAYIRAEYDPSGNGFAQLEKAMTDFTGRTQRHFEASAAEINRTLVGAMTRGLNSAGGIDLGVGQMREAAAQARLYSDGLKVTLTSAQALARSTNDTSAATRLYLQALRSQNLEAQRAVAAADAQVASYTRLQGAMDKAAARSGELAASFRALYAEEARAAQADVLAQ